MLLKALDVGQKSCTCSRVKTCNTDYIRSVRCYRQHIISSDHSIEISSLLFSSCLKLSITCSFLPHMPPSAASPSNPIRFTVAIYSHPIPPSAITSMLYLFLSQIFLHLFSLKHYWRSLCIPVLNNCRIQGPEKHNQNPLVFQYHRNDEQMYSILCSDRHLETTPSAGSSFLRCSEKCNRLTP